MTIEKIIVPAQPGLDPVYIYFEDIDKGAGRVVLICWDMAYTAYWGAMGDRKIKEFFSGCGSDYIMGNLLGRHYKQSAVDIKYMKRIVEAAQRHLIPEKAFGGK